MVIRKTPAEQVGAFGNTLLSRYSVRGGRKNLVSHLGKKTRKEKKWRKREKKKGAEEYRGG